MIAFLEPILKYLPIVQTMIIPLAIIMVRKLTAIAKLQRLVLGEDKVPGLVDRVDQTIKKVDNFITHAEQIDNKLTQNLVEIVTRLTVAEEEIKQLRLIKHKYDSLSQALLSIQEELKYIRERLDREINRGRDV
jgi:hypothetical protein